jgi:serine/threonine protein phosphatase 1
VHGHTFRSDYRVTKLSHRIGIDTGAFMSGQLTTLKLGPRADQGLELLV